MRKNKGRKIKVKTLHCSNCISDGDLAAGTYVPDTLEIFCKTCDKTLGEDKVACINNDILALGDKRALISDGYHTFGQLYYVRTVMFAALCNAYPDSAWKSRFHCSDEDPMYEGYFIAGVETEEGQWTLHNRLEYWDMFRIEELPRAMNFDGHSTMDVERLLTL